MEHKLFHSKFKHLVERSFLLDIIEESPSGENPHRVAAMELIFDKAIDDCRERVFTQMDKPPPTDPTVQPNSSEKEISLLSAATQSTTAKPSSKNKKSKPTTVQSVQTQDTPSVQPSQPSEIQPKVKDSDFCGLAAHAQAWAHSVASTVPDRVPTVGPSPTPPTTQTTGGFQSSNSRFGSRVNVSHIFSGAYYEPHNTVPISLGRPPVSQNAGGSSARGR